MACCFMCIFLFLMIVNIIPLARGGAYLLIEKENDAIHMYGTIEDTLEIGFLGGQKYPVDRNHGNGEATDGKSGICLIGRKRNNKNRREYTYER